MERELYWLWLMNIKGIGKKKIHYILKYFGQPENIFHALDKEIIEVLKGGSSFTSKDIQTILQSRDEKCVLQYHKKLINQGISYITIINKDYPIRLRNIYDPPKLIYYKGKLPRKEQPSIAIVGSRKCSEYGKNIAGYFSKELAKNNITVISGMARGIDTIAHKGALEVKGKTTAVLGCGINICYPKENLSLMRTIKEEGCILSEVPVNGAPIAANFPMRNRIISGLSDGVLVVEAASKSGSLITSDFALEQGKDVFAIPGRLTDKNSKGANKLIQMGAKLITCVDDILEELVTYKNAIKEYDSEQDQLSALSQQEKDVYEKIGFEPIHIDELFRKVNMPINELQLHIVQLELNGMIQQLPNQHLIKNIVED